MFHEGSRKSKEDLAERWETGAGGKQRSDRDGRGRWGKEVTVGQKPAPGRRVSEGELHKDEQRNKRSAFKVCLFFFFFYAAEHSLQIKPYLEIPYEKYMKCLLQH